MASGAELQLLRTRWPITVNAHPHPARLRFRCVVSNLAGSSIVCRIFTLNIPSYLFERFNDFSLYGVLSIDLRHHSGLSFEFRWVLAGKVQNFTREDFLIFPCLNSVDQTVSREKNLLFIVCPLTRSLAQRSNKALSAVANWLSYFWSTPQNNASPFLR
jgi:hypothetical protein